MVEDTQKRYADDITVCELVRLRTENERLRKALKRIEEIGEHLVWPVAEMRNTAMLALQGKELD